jgi:hypothetical protein
VSTCDGTATRCVVESDAGPSVLACCGLSCVDTFQDPAHCGNCATQCTAQEQCLEGNCYRASCAGAANGDSCLVGTSNFGQCCGGECLNPFTNAGNCGACGRACAPGAVCDTQRCVEPATQNTSACHLRDGGVTCPPDTQCVSTSFCLRTTCAADEDGYACSVNGATQGTCCGGRCAATRTESAHCGTCGNACGATEFCAYGFCTPQPTCTNANNGTACGLSNESVGSCCDATCRDLRADSANCGACGQACPEGAQCMATGTGNGTWCQAADGGATSCRVDGECAAGESCVTGECLRRACGAGVSNKLCAFGTSLNGSEGGGTCCNGDCVDMRQDGDHCGRCDQHCESGLCAGGVGLSQCYPSGTGTQCGGVGGGCFGTQVCVEGWCVEAACSGPFSAACSRAGGVGVCCGFGFSNMCVDILTDEANCGGCGLNCATGQTCSNGTCTGVTAPCGAGHAGKFCDADGGTSLVCCGSGCTDVQSDAFNCGRCGNPCAAGMACMEGVCGVASCAGTTDNTHCFGSAPNAVCCGGSCVDKNTDAQDCGVCGRRCAAGAVCQGGVCGVEVCDAPHAGSPCFMSSGGNGRCCADGCVNTQTSAANCGGCGLPCAPTETCVNGGCQ